jgi:hypothetical protein
MRAWLVLVTLSLFAPACERAEKYERGRAGNDGRPLSSSTTVLSALGGGPVDTAAPARIAFQMDSSKGEGCSAQLTQASGDLYLALTRGTSEQRASAALAILERRRDHARFIVQR